ncbi:MAG: 4-hydroxy-tetrahydrodipicolinate synthase [Planctomycetota bacterium]
MFRGSLVALVTPFRNGSLDHEAVEDLVRWHVEEGTAGIVVSGTTGESPTLTEDERVGLVETAVRAADGKVPIVAGTGSNDTARVIESSRLAERAGADALLVVTPYYNKPTQRGLLEHYRAVADAVELPICLYSVPGRTGVAIAPETARALAEHPRIAALKEAGGSVDRVSEIMAMTDLPILSGDDPLTLPMMAVGARGVVSVTANLLPGDVSRMARAALESDWETATALHHRLWPLSRAMFLETNPIPVKTALVLMGRVAEEFRLPLSPMGPDTRAKLEESLRSHGLLP